jgi:hypothetical protein
MFQRVNNNRVWIGSPRLRIQANVLHRFSTESDFPNSLPRRRYWEDETGLKWVQTHHLAASSYLQADRLKGRLAESTQTIQSNAHTRCTNAKASN